MRKRRSRHRADKCMRKSCPLVFVSTCQTYRLGAHPNGTCKQVGTQNLPFWSPWDPLLAPWGTIWESFWHPRPILNPTVATFRLLVKKMCNLEPIREKKLVHFGHMFYPKVNKSHKKPQEVGARTTNRTKIDFRPLPKWPNVASIQ